MGAIDNISKGVSEKLGNRLDKTEEEKAVLNYGLFIIIHTSLSIVLTFIAGLVTGMAIEIMTITFSAAWLKRYSGGVHANTPNRCLLIGIIVSLTLCFLYKTGMILLEDNMLLLILLIGIIVSYIVLYYKCPVGSKNKPLKKESTRKKLRKKAFTLINLYSIAILAGYLIYKKQDIYILKDIISCMWLGLLLQISMLTKFGQKLIDVLDDMLGKLKIS
ncbi:accessory gene regulator B family protein [Romboutsia sedimentorum]|uniref:accessory gene regulator ArgB-like protein n=1 Tax=Romboutsia sedimentorum TaxID=1368474 RepID=UPI0024DEBE07|nr:accessory gene regulator B family protein [Romboutsia sedimentorum]MDK2586208.1 accessory gene regulator B family protein [Romboutsia sedimentorum]